MAKDKRTDQLSRGDAVLHKGKVRRVTHTQQADRDRILVVFDDASSDVFVPGCPWALPTEDEIAAADAAAKREDMARALEHAVDLIRRHEVAPCMFSIDVRVSVRTIAELETWAEALDQQIRPGGTDGTIPAIDGDVERFGDIELRVHAQAHELYPRKSPADPPESLVDQHLPGCPAANSDGPDDERLPCRCDEDEEIGG